MIQIGIDSFPVWDNAGLYVSLSEGLRRLVEQIEYVNKIPNEKLMLATKLIGTSIAPVLREVGEKEVKVL